jgi:cellulose synthase/poly-beta-1,6-N-acetylglucosamine synthase-like glycosyltransferase
VSSEASLRNARPSSFRRPPPVLVLLSGLALLGAGLLLASPWGLALDLTGYVLASVVVFVDLWDLVVRSFRARRAARAAGGGPSTSVRLGVGEFTPYQMRLHLRPYAVVVAVHDIEDDFEDFLEVMAPHRERLWVIDDASKDGTWFRLERSGLRCVRTPVNLKKPGAIKELVSRLPGEIATVVVLDPDVGFRAGGRRGISDLERVLFDFQQSGRAAMSPRVVVREDGWLARMQQFEYGLACRLGRMSLADHSVTSGVAVYRRDALEAAFQSHTLSVYAEDMRNALILLGRGEGVYYDDRLVAETEGKRTWPAWFSQRVGWSYGFLRVYLENFRDVWRCSRAGPFFKYQYLVYMGLCALVLHPLRILSLALLVLSTVNGLDALLGLNWIPDTALTDPAYFLLSYVQYTAYALLASSILASDHVEWMTLLPTVPVYFFYGLTQILPSTVGYANWLSLRVGGFRVYRDHYQDEESLRRQLRGSP